KRSMSRPEMLRSTESGARVAIAGSLSLAPSRDGGVGVALVDRPGVGVGAHVDDLGARRLEDSDHLVTGDAVHLHRRLGDAPGEGPHRLARAAAENPAQARQHARFLGSYAA